MLHASSQPIQIFESTLHDHAAGHGRWRAGAGTAGHHADVADPADGKALGAIQGYVAFAVVSSSGRCAGFREH